MGQIMKRCPLSSSYSGFLLHVSALASYESRVLAFLGNKIIFK